jgi:adenosine deaminase
MDLYTFHKRLPKVSLHVHLAGTVQPSMLVALAGKNGVALSAYREPDQVLELLCQPLEESVTYIQSPARHKSV